jgi:predicted PurR-regulated permease PerM
VVATLLVFVLSPVVEALHRWGLGRVPAVILVVVLVVAALGGAGWALSVQVGALAEDLPRHTEAVKRRIAEWRPGPGGVLDRARGAVDAVVSELEKKVDGPVERTDQAPVPVIIRGESRPLIQRVPALARELASAGFVMVLVIFMLIELQSLRDRFIRIVGWGRFTLTTKALDEAGDRISRYLLSLSLVNAGIGLAFGLGLLLLGVPYALLWGTGLALARFVPYVGVWPAAALPVALSLAASDGWTRPLLVVALFLGLESLANVVVEPVLYSQGAGLSKVALLVAIGFWTWLWGPIGLILATPLTAGFVVLAKYVPALEPVAVLLGEPALAPPAVFYQRLVDRDVDEAAEVVERRLKASSLASVADEILIPALAGVRRDRAAGRLDEADQQFAVAAMRDLLEQAAGPAPDCVPTPAARLLACPVRDHIDAAALEILGRVLDSTGCAMEVLPAGLLSAEMVDRVTHHRPALVVVASVPPGGLAQTRHLLKHLRSAGPDLTILVGRWGAWGEGDAERSALPGVGADHIATSLGETRHQIQAILLAPAARLAA